MFDQMDADELRTLKKQIDDELRIRRNACIKSGCAIIKRNMNTKVWSLFIEKKHFYKMKKTVIISIADSNDRNDLINAIPDIVRDLNDLYTEAKGDSSNE